MTDVASFAIVTAPRAGLLACRRLRQPLFISAIAPSPKVPLLPLVAEGDPAEALLAAAKDANLLVLGTSGRSRLTGFLLGSVSSRCAAAAQCPVLLVKAPPGQAET